MPNFPWSARGDGPPAGDAAFEALLAGKLPPEDAAGGLRPLAEAIAALTVPPVRSEIATEPSARAAYRAGFARPARTVPMPRRWPRHRRPAFVSLVTVRLAAASVVLLALLAAAAYSGMLPAPAQRFAHDSFGAPAPHQTAHVVPLTTPVRPPRPVPAAHGLCTAYSRAQARGKINQKSAVFRRLATLAGGPAKVPAYCAAVIHPGKGPPGKTGETPPGQVGKTPPGQAGKTPPGRPASHPAEPPDHARHPGQPTASPNSPH
jgi:hypothetical protein